MFSQYGLWLLIYKFFNLAPPPIPSFINRYERDCIAWYVDETMAMAEIYKKKFPGVTYAEVAISELNTLHGIKKLFSHFGMRTQESIDDFVGQATNQRIKA